LRAYFFLCATGVNHQRFTLVAQRENQSSQRVESLTMKQGEAF
jgi:hypothetical protein